MSDFDQMNTQTMTQEARAREINEGLRIYMSKVYNHMAIGLLVTALIAYLGAASGLYMSLASTPLIYVLMFAPFAMAMYFTFRFMNMTSTKARNVFYIYAALMGLSLSSVFLVFTGQSITTTFLITAAAFGSLSLYGYTTKRDLGPLGAFLFMGLIGIILASLVNMFVGSASGQFAISVMGVLLFAGLTAYDTQAIKQIYFAGDTREVAEKKAIHGAFRLYLDFINMFLFLLQFLGNRE